MNAHELIALCAPRPTFISYGAPDKGDTKWLDHQGSYMAAVAAGPVFRLLGTKDLGTTDDYRTEKMPAVNVRMLGGQLAWRQHDGGHTDDGKLFEGMMGDQLHPAVRGIRYGRMGCVRFSRSYLGAQGKVDHAPAATGDPKAGR